MHATPGPETADATGDPMVITRFLYKPTASEGNTRFNDNRRLHIFLLDVASRSDPPADRRHLRRALDRLVARRRRDPVRLEPRADADQFFNNDIFAVRVGNGAIRRLTTTENAEY